MLFIKKKLFGRYPQTKVTDTCLINSLKNIFDRNEYGYIDEYIEESNSQLEQLGLGGLQYEKRNENRRAS